MTGADLIALQAEADEAISWLRDNGQPKHMDAVYRLRMAVLEQATGLQTIRRAVGLLPAE